MDGLDLQALIAEARKAQRKAQETRADVTRLREQIKDQRQQHELLIEDARRLVQALQGSQNGRWS